MKYVEILAAQTDPKHVAFLYDHHHLISPWAFSETQRVHREGLLFRSHFNEASAKNET